MKSTKLFLLMICFIFVKFVSAQMPDDYVSIYTIKGETEITPVEIGAQSTYQLAGPASGWGSLADWDFSKYRKLVINFTFDAADAGNMVAVRFNVNATATDSKVKLLQFTLPTTGTNYSAEIDLEQYADSTGKVGVGGIVFYNGASHWSFTYDGTATTKPVTINYVALADKIIDPAEMPDDYVSIYSVKGETELTPVEIGAQSTYQLAGPASGWGSLADWDFSKYRKLVINFTFDAADAGNMVAVRFNVNATATDSKVKLLQFTLPATGTNYSAVIDLEQYADSVGNVGIGGIVFYNGASHWSFTYEGTATTKPVTVNYVALADEIIDPTKKPDDYLSIYAVKGETEITPLEIGAQATYQLAGPASGWGGMSDWNFSKYKNLVINFTYDAADSGKVVAIRFNVNATATDSKVSVLQFTLPATGTVCSAVIDLEQYADSVGNVGVGGIIFYNGASHWSFTYEGTPATQPVTVNYVAVGPVEGEVVYPTTELVVDNVIDGTVTDESDYKFDAQIRWDADSIYLAFSINDDTLYDGAENAWDNDNIELYFDMDNSKNPTWPRNAGWPATSYDANDYQLRILPGKSWDAYNTTVTGANLVTTMREGGYDITVNIPWSSLLDGFTPAAGAKIGFDILASDNDGDYRNQITWNAKTAMPWNDASLFGTLEFIAGGTFKQITDTKAPEKPVVTATVEGSSVTLSWPVPDDDVAVMSYDVLQDGVAIKESIYAIETGNSLTVKDLAEGTYKFRVVCYDNTGNISSTVVTVVVDNVSVVDITAAVEVYPNPSSGIVQVVTGSSNASVMDIYKLNGESIMRKTFVNSSIVDLSNLSKGMYIFRVTTNNKVKTSKVEIK